MAYVSSSPHVSDKTTTRTIMLDVIIALLPATIFEFIILAGGRHS